MSLRSVEDVLLELADSFPEAAGGPAEGAIVEVTRLVFNLPLESRFGVGGALYASLPRGILATGFDPPLGRVYAVLERSVP